uniref:Uncharacterized protein n=1 Tax=Zea mays TaxID=4577 RepID=C4J0X0_MAIZE|nr:unknown [Zea mays]
MTSFSKLATLGGYLPKSDSTNTAGDNAARACSKLLGWCATMTWSAPPNLLHSGRAVRYPTSFSWSALSLPTFSGGKGREWRL